ncbi:thioredoxin-dependent thiol peroxidase [Rhizobium sp. CRIBSB]|nr:thioredoxin-dependent thiol peroxidase [Rhizobium sp. CRIBSB]
MTDLTAGDMAPEFSLPRNGGGTVSLSDFAGKPVILYFYPKDDTSGCTTEAIDFTGLTAEFEELGASVIGVSPDSVKSHDKFAAKHNLSVVLAADEEHKALEAYGVWKEKSMYGKTYMGVERSTFLIDKSGKIAEVWRKVKVPGHAEAVLKAAQAL